MTDTSASLAVPPPPRLGWRAQRRPVPGFAHVLGAAAGAFAVVAVVAFVVEVSSDDPTAPGVLLDAALAFVALIAGFRAAGPVRSACTTALVLTVPLIWVFALFGGGNASRGDVRFFYLLTAATYLVIYLVGWTRGRAILLAGALLVFAGWALFEVAGSGSNNLVPFQDRIDSSQSSGLLPDSTLSTTGDNTSSTAAVSLVIGLAFLGSGALLDRRRLEGVATPFVGVGTIYAVTGAVVLGGNESLLLGGILAIGAGAVVGVVGGQGDRRRATTWIGVLTVFGGLVAVIVDIAPSSAAGVGGIATAFAIVLGVLAWWLAPRLGEPDDGDDLAPLPPPAPPGGDVETERTPTEAAA